MLNLNVCNIRKKCINYETAKLNSKKWKKLCIYEEMCFVGLVPGERSFSFNRDFYLCVKNFVVGNIFITSFIS